MNGLGGRRVLITRSADQTPRMADDVRAAGGIPIVLPLITITPAADMTACDAAVRRLSDFNAVVMTSANAVRFFLARCRVQGVGVEQLRSLTWYAVGAQTARIIEEAGIQVEAVPAEATGAALGRLLAQRGIGGKLVLFPQGNIARGDALLAVEDAGGIATAVVVYETSGPDDATRSALRTEMLSHQGQAVLFASPSAVLHFCGAFTAGERAALIPHITVGVIGPATAEAAHAEGLPVHFHAEVSSDRGLVDALVRYCRGTAKNT